MDIYNTQTKKQGRTGVFGVFKAAAQRFTAMETLATTLRPLFQKPRLEDEDKIKIVETLLKTKQVVDADHRSSGILAAVGMTKSRLSSQLTQAINSLVENKFVTRDQVSQCESKMVTAEPPSKYRI